MKASQNWTIINVGDTRNRISSLDDNSVQTIITSPPYYGLRNYGIDGQIGLEPTPQQYVEQLVDIFRECRRVLRPDGTFWLNIGDSYARDARKGQHKPGDPGKQNYVYEHGGGRASAGMVLDRSNSLKPKDLIGVPWMLAFALRDDGWYLRSDIIWHKPNALPESVKDRPTNTHEHIFLLSKSERYFYDSESVKEPTAGVSNAQSEPGVGAPTRNLRNVWSINTKPFKGAHFATFPPDLVEQCVKAGSSKYGNCTSCGTPWKRLTGKLCEDCGELIPTQAKSCPGCGVVRDWKKDRGLSEDYTTTDWSTPGKGTPRKLTDNGKQAQVGNNETIDAGWVQGCSCETDTVNPAIVLDPFGGAGTTALIANKLGRNSILLEINPDYAKMSYDRLTDADLTVAMV